MGLQRLSSSLVTFQRRLALTVSRFLHDKLLDQGLSVKDFGAKGDGVTDDTAAFRRAASALKTLGGGTLFIPEGVYKLSPIEPRQACVTFDCDNVRITGLGYLSKVKVSNNKDVAFHFCKTADLETPDKGDPLLNCGVDNVKLIGTGVYQYFSLAYGRGLLARNIENFKVHHCEFEGFSMIGACVEGGDGMFDFSHNYFKDCKYTGANFNGRCFGSIVAHNIVTGTNGNINAMGLQICGPSLVSNNVVIGDVNAIEKSGGIILGEGNWEGQGVASGNIVINCRYGIQEVYHGAWLISNNLVVNCTVTGGIRVLGGTTSSFTVEAHHTTVKGNQVINCAPYQIEISGHDCTLEGNMLLNIKDAVAPTAPGAPDVIRNVTTQAGIRINGERCNVINNTIEGSVYGIVYKYGYEQGIRHGNIFKNLKSAEMVLELGVSKYDILPVSERKCIKANTYVDEVYFDSIPNSYHPVGSVLRRRVFAAGQPATYGCIQSGTVKTTQVSPTGATVIMHSGGTIVPSATMTRVGVRLVDDKIHWTFATASSAGSVTLAAGLPKDAAQGADLLYTAWRVTSSIA